MRRLFPQHCAPWRRQAAAMAHHARALATAKKQKKGEEKPVIGVVGIGKMGAAMASNFLESNVGAEIVVHDPFNAPAVEALVGKGARAASLEEVGRRCSVVVTMLPNDKELMSVSRDLVSSLRPGSLHISCSTVSPSTSRAVAAQHTKKHVSFVGAPVFARPDGVVRREAYFVAGATDAAALEQASPILLATGSRVFPFSTTDAGAGNAVKLAGNFLIASAIESIGEALALAEAQGLDRTQVMDMLSSTIFDCLIYKGYGQRISQRDHRPGGFSLELGHKDVALVCDTAKQSKVPMPVASLLHDRFLASVNRGRGEMDWSAVALAISDDAGVKRSSTQPARNTGERRG